jgi:hypothetical protein
MPLPIPALIPQPFQRPQITPKPAVSTTSYSDPLRAMTIKALQERQKSLESQQVDMPSMLSPWQGVSYALDKFMHGLNEGRTQRAETAAEQGRAALMGQIDPTTGATEQQIAQMGQFDPEMMQALWADRARRAQADQWIDIPPPPGAPPGTIWQRNKASGDVQEIGGKGGGVSVVNMPETKGDVKWQETTSGETGKQLATIYDDGNKAAERLSQIDLMEQFLPVMLHGTPAAISEYMRQNWGVDLGPAANATTAFNSIVNSLVPKERGPGTGTMSDKDVVLFKSFFPSMLTSPLGNKLITSYLRGIAQYHQQLGAIANRAMSMPSAVEGRNFYSAEAAKLANPLADIGAKLTKLGFQQTAAGATGKEVRDMTDAELEAEKQRLLQGGGQ